VAIPSGITITSESRASGTTIHFRSRCVGELAAGAASASAPFTRRAGLRPVLLARELVHVRRSLHERRGGVGRRRRAGPVELRDHPVVDPPAAVAAADDVGVDGRDGVPGARLREQQHLEPDLVAVRVVDGVPGALPVLGRGVRHDWDVSLAPLLVRDVLAERRPGELPRVGDAVPRDRRGDEARQHLPDRAPLLGGERRALGLPVDAALCDVGPVGVLLRSRSREMDREVGERRRERGDEYRNRQPATATRRLQNPHHHRFRRGPGRRVRRRRAPARGRAAAASGRDRAPRPAGARSGSSGCRRCP
jgi:hypothetical protein